MLIKEIAGPLFDYGYFCILLLLGTFFLNFGMMMTSLCGSYWQIIWVTAGLGCGCLFVPGTAVFAGVV